jgi:hypothetical protein
VLRSRRPLARFFGAETLSGTGRRFWRMGGARQGGWRIAGEEL